MDIYETNQEETNFNRIQNNDRLKYRIWDNKENKYYKPTYEGYNGNIEELFLSPCGELSMRTFYEFIHESCFQNRFTIEQCTGLKDKIGKLIFEGDIVNCHEVTNSEEIKYTSDVFWNSLSWTVRENEWCDVPLHIFDDNVLDKCPITEIEIIGNIHDKGES